MEDAMNSFTRRGSLAAGAALVAAGQAVAQGIPAANTPPPRLTPEPGARLRVLRPARFVEPDEVIFTANTRKFSQATGVEVRVDYVGWDDMPAQTAVAANTGQGPDVIIGFGADPHLYADKVVEVTDIAEYLGAKYGGWYPLAETYGRRFNSRDWLGVPMGGSGSPSLYRISAVRAAGFDGVPSDLGQFLRLCEGLKRGGKPCGFALSHAPGDAPGYANWLLWSHGGRLLDEQGRVALESAATLRALEYSRAMQATMIEGTMGWNGVSNNRAFIGGDLGLTQNGVSVYFALKNATDADQRAMAADTDHAEMPRGEASATPQSGLVLNAMVMRHSRAQQAAKAYITFMMEAEQYDPWLTGSLGYWSQPLRAYGQSAVWRSDPKIRVFSATLDTPFHDAYSGPITAGSAAVAANWVLVDMFARVATGQSSAQDSMREAVRAAQRHLRRS
jgi:multiple sugar transport system substrate-binding protein